MTDSTYIPTLHELIAALDRRRPRADHPAEAAIAQDAAALKNRALAQIAALEDAGRA